MSMKGVSYLLVEQSPEHGQRDVEEEHPEDHLHLRNQEFLVPNSRREKSVFLRSVVNLVAGFVDTLVGRIALTSYFSSAQSIQWVLLG